MSAPADPGADVKFCPSCNSAVNAHAVFCEYCGSRLGGFASKKDSVPKPEPAPEPDATTKHRQAFDSRASQKLAHRLHREHVALAREFRSRAAAMLEEATGYGDAIAELEMEAVGPERTRRVQGVLEELERVGDSWEDLQFEYNKRSEELDDEFSDRRAELEVDVDLPPQMQNEIVEEVSELVSLFDHVGKTIATHGDHGNAVIGGAQGRWFGAAKAPAGGAGDLVIWMLGVVGAVAVLVWFGVAYETVALGVAPVLLARILGSLLRRG